MIRFFLIPLLMLFLAPATVMAQASPDTAMESYLSDTFGTEGPGVAVLVSKNGKILYRDAVGYDLVEARKPLSPDQPFRLGSITKTFVAATVLRLVEQGLIELGAPVSQYLPQVRDERITVRQLLTHRAGLPRGYGVDLDQVLTQDRRWPLSEYIALALGQEPMFEPGTSQMYSNAGYTLLGGVIEAATRRPWHEVVFDEVIAPTGVKSIYFGPETGEISGLATGHWSGGQVFAPTARFYVFQDPAQSFVGDLDGLQIWFEALFDGRILAESSLELMTTPVGKDIGGTGTLGAGLMTAQVREIRGFFHSGRVPGYGTAVVYLPDPKLFVAVFSNDDETRTQPQHAAIMLASLAIDAPLGAERNPAALALPQDSWFGRYAANERTMNFVANGPTGMLFEFDTGASQVLAPAGSGVLLGPGTGSEWAVLDIDSAGTPIVRWNVLDKSTEVWRRVGDATEIESYSLSSAEASVLTGTYQLPIGPFIVALGEDGTLRVSPPGMSETAAKVVSPTRLVVDSIGITVDFEKGTDGLAQTISISMGGATLQGAKVE